VKHLLTWLRRHHPVSSVVLSPLVVAALVATVAWVVVALLAGPDWYFGNDLILAGSVGASRLFSAAAVVLIAARTRALRGIPIGVATMRAAWLLGIVLAFAVLPAVPMLAHSATLVERVAQSPERASLCDPGPDQPFPSVPVDFQPGSGGAKSEDVTALSRRTVEIPAWIRDRVAVDVVDVVVRYGSWFEPARYCGSERAPRDSRVRMLHHTLAWLLWDELTGRAWIVSTRDGTAMLRMEYDRFAYGREHIVRLVAASVAMGTAFILFFFLPGGRRLSREITLRDVGGLALATSPLVLGWLAASLFILWRQTAAFEVAGTLMAVLSVALSWWVVLRALRRNRYALHLAIYWPAAVLGLALLPLYPVIRRQLDGLHDFAAEATIIATVVCLALPFARVHHRIEHLPD
jgi:hypothetical protein